MQPSISPKNVTNIDNSKNQTSPSSQAAIIADRGKTKNLLLRTTSEKHDENIAQNSTGNSSIVHQSSFLETAHDNDSSTLYRHANLTTAEGTNNNSLTDIRMQNASHNITSLGNERLTFDVSLPAINLEKMNATNDTLDLKSLNSTSSSTQNTYTEVYDEHTTFKNRTRGDTGIKNNSLSLTASQSDNRNNNTSTVSPDVTEIVNSTGSYMFLKDAINSQNISEKMKSTENNKTTSRILSENATERNQTLGKELRITIQH